MNRPKETLDKAARAPLFMIYTWRCVFGRDSKDWVVVMVHFRVDVRVGAGV